MLSYAFNHKQNQHTLEKNIIRFVATGMKRSASESPTMSGLNPRKLWSSELPGATRHRSRPRFGTGSSLAWRHVILGVLREGGGKVEWPLFFCFFRLVVSKWCVKFIDEQIIALQDPRLIDWIHDMM